MCLKFNALLPYKLHPSTNVLCSNIPRRPSRLYVQEVGIARSPDFLFLHLITALLFFPRSLRFQSLMVASWEQVRNSSLILGCQLPELMTAVCPLFLVWSSTYWSPLTHSSTFPPSRSRTCTQDFRFFLFFSDKDIQILKSFIFLSYKIIVHKTPNIAVQCTAVYFAQTILEIMRNFLVAPSDVKEQMEEAQLISGFVTI